MKTRCLVLIFALCGACGNDTAEYTGPLPSDVTSCDEVAASKYEGVTCDNSQEAFEDSTAPGQTVDPDLVTCLGDFHDLCQS